MNKLIEQIKAQALEKYPKTLPEGSTGYSSRIQRVNDFLAGSQAVLAKVKDILEGTRANDVDDDPLKDPLRNEGRESLREEILEKLKD